MKAAWLDRGQTPVGTLKNYGIDTVLFDGRDAAVDQTLLSNARNAGFRPGIYEDPSWYSFSTGDFATDFAQKVSDDLAFAGFGGQTSPTSCCVVLDIEFPHRAEIVPAILAAWRKLRPRRETYWTMEALQGGWVRGIHDAVVKANVGLLPQPYGEQLPGGELVHYAEDYVRQDLTVGPGAFEDARVQLCYDARLFRPTSRWARGVMFTQGRLA